VLEFTKQKLVLLFVRDLKLGDENWKGIRTTIFLNKKVVQAPSSLKNCLKISFFALYFYYFIKYFIILIGLRVHFLMLKDIKSDP